MSVSERQMYLQVEKYAMRATSTWAGETRCSLGVGDLCPFGHTEAVDGDTTNRHGRERGKARGQVGQHVKNVLARVAVLGRWRPVVLCKLQKLIDLALTGKQEQGGLRAR